MVVDAPQGLIFLAHHHQVSIGHADVVRFAATDPLLAGDQQFAHADGTDAHTQNVGSLFHIRWHSYRATPLFTQSLTYRAARAMAITVFNSSCPVPRAM